jgi:hypothetical protein
MKKYMTRTNLGWLLTGLITFALLGSAAGKLTGGMEEMFTKNGIVEWTTIIAIGEILSVLLFVYPKTRTFGTMLLSSYFGGAIMLHMSHAEPFVGPAVFLVAIWAIAWIRGVQLIES